MDVALPRFSHTLTPQQLCDLELIQSGAFAPLTGFMNDQDYHAVLSQMRLANGSLWPIPITLAITQDLGDQLSVGDDLLLQDEELFPLATLTIAGFFNTDWETEAQAVFASCDPSHPGVAQLMQSSRCKVYGKLCFHHTPHHYDFTDLRLTPAAVKAYFQQQGWDRIVAFQTRNPLHRAHVELTQRAAQTAQAKILLHPVVGVTKPGDVDHFTRVKCYQAILPHYPADQILLALLPLAMRMAGPKEALWHALIRKNFGCTHFIVGRDHAGPGHDAQGKPFYDPYAAQTLVAQHATEIGIEMLPFEEMVYVTPTRIYKPVSQVTNDETVQQLSGTQLRERLQQGETIPAWFSYPEVITELRKRHPKPTEGGLCVFFTGLSGAGKSAIANALMIYLMANDARRVTLLDGDVVRQHLSKGLGFSKADRDTNILRIGYVASEIVKHGGIAICAPIAPYAATRQAVRDLITSQGQFVEVFVSTPLTVCEARDRKGLYAKARAGELTQFTGIDDPYEAPTKADCELDASHCSIQQSLDRLIAALREKQLLADSLASDTATR